MRTSITCLVVLVAAIPASARIINVPAEYPTIQAGIDASVNGDTVLVAPGEYTENISINGKEITLTSSNGPYETTIVGHLGISDFADSAGCIFQGFTLVNQNNDPYVGQPGIEIDSGKPRIVGNIIRHHYWNNFGGAIRLISPYAVISHNIMEDNWAMGAGGGIHSEYGVDIEISYNIIRNNRSGYGYAGVGLGAGIYISRGRIFYNLIYDNSVRCITQPGPFCGCGGGVFWSGRLPSQIYNNTIANNIAIRNTYWGDGGGIFADHYSFDTLIIENNIIAFNQRGGLAIRYHSPESLYLAPERYNLLFGNQAYDISAPDTSLTDIFADPLFTDTCSQDYSLLAGSPCIDAGDPTFPLDPDSTRVDIGALFFDRRVEIDGGGTLPSYQFELHQNYPNPFNAQTTISYALPEASQVSLIVFDISGRIVRRFSRDASQEAGTHRYVWDGTDISAKPVPTGIYFYLLQVNDIKMVRSMILLK